MDGMGHVIKARAHSGTVNEIPVAEIIEIDGRPYKGDPADLRDQVLYITGVVDEMRNQIAQITRIQNSMVPVEISTGADTA